MIDYNYLKNLPRGEDSLAYLKKAIAESDNEKDIKDMMWARYYYIKESVFYGDTFKGLLTFPELKKLYEENPDVMPADTFAYPFKWIVEDSPYYYQISKEQIDRYLDSYKEFLLKNGSTLRSYYLKKCGAYQSIDCRKAYEVWFELEKYERSDMDDGEIYEKSELIHLEAMLGSPEKAISMLNEMLDRGYGYDDFPPQLFGDMAYDLAKHGMFDEADHYAAIMMFYIGDNVVQSMKQCAYTISFKLITGPAYAYQLFCKCMNEWIKLKNPSYKFHFANAAHRLMKKMNSDGTEEIELDVIPEFELYNQNGIYRTDELAKYFGRIAEDIGKKFDERNENTMFSDELSFEFPESSDEKIKLPLHGKVTPVAASFGVLFKDESELPSSEEIMDVLKEVLDCKDISEEDEKQPNLYSYLCTAKNGELLRFAAFITDMPEDVINAGCTYFLPEGAEEEINDYRKMVIIASGQIYSNAYEELLKVMTIADRLNTGGCPVAVSINSAMTVSSVWLRFAALSKAPPAIMDWLNFNIILYDEGGEEAAVSTMGLNLFGSRELVVENVQRRDINFCMNILGKIAESISLGNMPDEGIKANSGLVYDGEYYVRFIWENCEIPKEGTFAKVKLCFNTEKEKNVITEIADLPEEERDKLSYAYDSRINRYEALRYKNLFGYALEYFRNNECSLKAEFVIKTERKTAYIYTEIIGDGTKAKVIDVGDVEGMPKKGDIIDVESENVVFFRIETADRNYRAEDMYVLFS